MKVYIGTSGWRYKTWKDTFYKEIPQNKWLGFYSKKFNAVEINATFYRNLDPQVYRKWISSTPDNFSFVVKGTRQITHIKRLKGDIERILMDQKKNLLSLSNRLKAVLWQLPPGLKKDINILRDFLETLNHNWEDTLHVLEFRHKSWFDDDTAQCLYKFGAVNCISDSPKWPIWEMVVSNCVYIRLHGHIKLYKSKYSEEEIRQWGKKIKTWLDEGKDVFVFFDNTGSGAAPYNAMYLKEILKGDNN